MKAIRSRRARSACLHFEHMEQRVLFSSYSIAPIANLATSTTAPGSGSNLVRDSAGDLFGTTAFGGTADDGSVFEIPISTGKLQTIWNFDGTGGIKPNELVIDSSGNLYGTTFSSNNTADPIFDSNGLGTVFEIPVGYTSLQTLVNFTDASTGENPHALAIDPAGNLFGATTAGGNSYGTLFEVAATSHTFSTIYTFQYADGVDSYGLTYANGNLYGVTYAGGSSNSGTVYELANESSPLIKRADFDGGANGASPVSAPYVDATGNVFGTVSGGGASSEGGVFEVPSNGTGETVVASFDGTNGASPQSTLVPDSSGNLFGISIAGGANGDGTVFEFDSATGTTALADFDDKTAVTPAYGLVADASGNFFGTTSTGGANATGVVYKVTPGSPSGGGGGTAGTGAVTPTVTKSTVPTTAVAGVKAKPSRVAVTISNAGTTAAVATTQLYASVNGPVDSASLVLGKPKKQLVKASKTVKAIVAVPPLMLAAGTYTLLVQTTDGTGGVSVATVSTITVAAAFVTLGATVGAVKPVSAKPGKAINFTIALTNTGNIDAGGIATVDVGLSLDSSTVATALAPGTTKVKVKSGGKPTLIHVHSTLPIDTTALSYYPIVTVTIGDNTANAVGQSTFDVA